MFDQRFMMEKEAFLFFWEPLGLSFLGATVGPYNNNHRKGFRKVIRKGIRTDLHHKERPSQRPPPAPEQGGAVRRLARCSLFWYARMS